MIKNHYIGRTFITPGQSYRELKVKLKLSPVREVHVRIASPPIRYPCYMGVTFQPGTSS